MSRKTKGMRSGTRKRLRLKPRERGKLRITKFLQEFEIGQKVVIKIDPRWQKGMPHPRFDGRVAEVIEKRGRSYVVSLKDGSITKKFSVSPVHLKPL